MMAMVCSTNWVLVSLIGTWKQNKYQMNKDQSSERKITICILPENNNCDFKGFLLYQKDSHNVTHRSLRVKELANAVP